MQLSKVTYALVAAGLIGGVATFYNQIDTSPSPRRRQPAVVGGAAVIPTAAANLPDFTALVDRVGPAVVNISVVHDKGKADGRPRRRRRGQPVPRVLQALRRRHAERPAHDAAAAVARHGLGLHRQQRRLHRHQRARRRRRLRSDGQAHRSPRVHGEGARRRQAHRHRAHQDRGQEPARARLRAQHQRQARRVGDRDRRAVRLREQRLRRCGERRASRAAERPDGAVHPDRRRRESRQLGRPAAQRQGPGGRRQLADLQPLGRLHGPVVRDSDRRRGQGRRADQDARQGVARPSRHRHPGPRPVARAELRSRRRQRRAGRLVEKDSPAAKAGFKTGDVIRKIDGVAVGDSTDVTSRIGNTAPGHEGDGRGVARRQAGRAHRARSARWTMPRSRRPRTTPTPRASSVSPCVR